MSGNNQTLEEQLAAAKRRLASCLEHCQLLEQYLHRAGMVLKSHGLAAERILENSKNLPKSAENSLKLMVEDGKKGVIVDKNSPELEMNWGKDEHVGAGSGAANGPDPTVWMPELARSSAVIEDYLLIWDAERNEYVRKDI